MLIDSHTHLESFPDEELPAVLERARTVGVGCIVSAGTTLASSDRSVELARMYGMVFAGVGIHPMDLVAQFDTSAYLHLKKLVYSSEKVLVISETGLDFTEHAPGFAVQEHAFRQQIRLARETSRPLVFHSRDAHNEVLRVLNEEKASEVGGVMHYFQSDYETASRAIDMGFYISLAKPLLRLPELQEVAVKLPLERIVLESDSAPQPFKSKRENWTEPRHVRQVAEKLADLKGSPLQDIETITTNNFMALIGERAGIMAHNQ